jgi:hypothetical protein
MCGGGEPSSSSCTTRVEKGRLGSTLLPSELVGWKGRSGKKTEHSLCLLGPVERVQAQEQPAKDSGRRSGFSGHCAAQFTSFLGGLFSVIDRVREDAELVHTNKSNLKTERVRLFDRP